jgi:hypothetical protein
MKYLGMKRGSRAAARIWWLVERLYGSRNASKVAFNATHYQLIYPEQWDLSWTFVYKGIEARRI